MISAYEARILNVLVNTLVPRTDRLPERSEDMNLVRAIEDHLSIVSPKIRVVFRLALILFDAWALFSEGGRFHTLEVTVREEYIEDWRRSRLLFRRLLFKLLQSIPYLNYYGQPSVNEKIGYYFPKARPHRDLPAHIPGATIQGEKVLRTDVCVIGAGAGGAVVAKELAEKGRDVLLLEEGDYFSANDFGVEPLEIVKKIYHQGGLQTTLGFPPVLLPTGRAVGGTTIINSGTCFRLPDKVLGRWQEEFGLSDLTPGEMGPYFDRVEEHLEVVPVSDAVLGKNAELVRDGLRQMGLDGEPLHRNARTCQGSGVCCFGCPIEAKRSVDLSYIPKGIEKGLKLFTQCRVDQVISRGSHGGLVSAETPNGRLWIDARVVVLAAGTLNTPRLLRKNHLAIHNPHVGRHLSIHPATKLTALFEQDVTGWVGVPQGYSFEGLRSEGLMFEGVFTPPSTSAAHLDLPPRMHKSVMEDFRKVAFFGFMVSDSGRGWIRWLPNGDPIIYYSVDRKDVTRFIKGLKFLAEVFFASGAKSVFPGLHGLDVVHRSEGLGKFDRKFSRSDLTVGAFHPLGTCRMGRDPSGSVVNSYGEIHHIKNLFITDGSIFPTPLGVNPQETIMAFATRTANYIDATCF